MSPTRRKDVWDIIRSLTYALVVVVMLLGLLVISRQQSTNHAQGVSNGKKSTEIIGLLHDHTETITSNTQYEKALATATAEVGAASVYISQTLAVLCPPATMLNGRICPIAPHITISVPSTPAPAHHG